MFLAKMFPWPPIYFDKKFTGKFVNFAQGMESQPGKPYYPSPSRYWKLGKCFEDDI